METVSVSDNNLVSACELASVKSGLPDQLKDCLKSLGASWRRQEECNERLRIQFREKKYTINLFLLDEANHKDTLAKTRLSKVDYGIYTNDKEVLSTLVADIDPAVGQKRKICIEEEVDAAFEELKQGVFADLSCCSICLKTIPIDCFDSDVDLDSDDGCSDYECNESWIKKCHNKYVNKDAASGKSNVAFATGCYDPHHLVCRACVPSVMEQNAIKCLLCNKKRRFCFIDEP